MSKVFGNNVFACNPITQAELEEADSFDALAESTTVKLVARIEESREGVARTTKVQKIEGYGPVLFSSEVFSMHRLLWADGVMVNKTKTKTTNTKATFVAFKVNLQSQTKSSGAGSDKPVRWARIQVELHGTGPDADKVEAKRPCLVGWAPFATMQRPNKTTAQHTSSRNASAGFQAGASGLRFTSQATSSGTRVWEKRYFDKYHSRPLSVLGASKSGDTESSDFNGVVWTMEMNSQEREGVVPELLMYLLMTRQDDSEYAVKITANIATGKLFESLTRGAEHKCVLRVTPEEPSLEKPAVCYLEGAKMWESLDANHLESLLSPEINSRLVLPWEVDETEMVSTQGAKSGAVLEKNNEAAESENNNDDGTEEEEVVVEDGNTPPTEPNATLSVAMASTKEHATDPTLTVPTTGQEAAAPLVDEAILDALGLSEGGGGHNDNDAKEGLLTRMAMLESRIEVMEYRMARQALVIRALLKHKGR